MCIKCVDFPLSCTTIADSLNFVKTKQYTLLCEEITGKYIRQTVRHTSHIYQHEVPRAALPVRPEPGQAPGEAGH